MSGRAQDTFALAYRDVQGRGDWWFIPTVPVARRWRGPFPTEAAMKVKAREELGAGVTVIETKCPPGQLPRSVRGLV
jgi:hypothetical protein